MSPASDRPSPRPGDRLFVPGHGGGPCTSRLVTYPPPIEILDGGGIYVLNDDGTQDDWHFWVPT